LLAPYWSIPAWVQSFRLPPLWLVWYGHWCWRGRNNSQTMLVHWCWQGAVYGIDGVRLSIHEKLRRNEDTRSHSPHKWLRIVVKLDGRSKPNMHYSAYTRVGQG
jgi:hypothetical protein